MQAINVLEELRSGRLDPALLDVFFAYRLLLGRHSEFTGPDSYARRRGNGDLSDFVLEFIASEEFANKWTDLPALHRTGDLIV